MHTRYIQHIQYEHALHVQYAHIHAPDLHQAFYYVEYYRERILLDAVRCIIFIERRQRERERRIEPDAIHPLVIIY